MHDQCGLETIHMDNYTHSQDTDYKDFYVVYSELCGDLIGQCFLSCDYIFSYHFYIKQQSPISIRVTESERSVMEKKKQLPLPKDQTRYEAFSQNYPIASPWCW